jgi:hypothetical protein
MIWLFERGGEAIRVETRFDNATTEYVAVVVWADGQSETERFTDYQAFYARILALEHKLAADEWSQIGPPTLMSDGWRL